MRIKTPRYISICRGKSNEMLFHLNIQNYINELTNSSLQQRYSYNITRRKLIKHSTAFIIAVLLKMHKH